MSTIKIKAYPMLLSNWGCLKHAGYEEPPSTRPASVVVEVDPSDAWYLREPLDARHHIHFTTPRGVVRVKKCELPKEIQRLFPKRIERGPSEADMAAAKQFDWSGLE